MAINPMTLSVELRTQKGVTHKDIQLSGDAISISQVFQKLAALDWAADLFSGDQPPVCLVPGYLVVLDNLMIQPWEYDRRTILANSQLKIIQVVPGG